MVRVIVCYDTDSEECRVRLRELLRDFGGCEVQYSVFELDIPPGRLSELVLRLKVLSSMYRVHVLVIPLCSSCSSRSMVICHEDYGERESLEREFVL
ncbi:MAG: CRISPR-associated endonuclease Cas2 [Thermoprotei archaeon]|nr:MAG: CRISPR-associated endonuclease Cas2 [Thermoprotei archaeon]